MTANAKDLTTIAYVKTNIPSISGSGQDVLLQQLVTACSDAIAKYCRRDFYSRFYDELYNGNDDRRLLLRQYPIQSVQSIRYRPVTVLKVINNNQTLNQQARVQVTSTGLTLWAMSSGVPSSDTSCVFATYPTLAAIAANINTNLGIYGWVAQTTGEETTDYGLWPSADLWIPPSYGDGLTSQGNLTARGVYCELKMHTYELAGYQFDPRGWLLRAIPYTDPELLHPEDLVFPPGINNFRVQYTAGYTTIPQAVAEACSEWVTQMWYVTARDPAILNYVNAPSAGGSTATAWAPPTYTKTALSATPPARVMALLAPYRRHTVANHQG